MNKAIFVGISAAIFSGVTLMIIISQVSPTSIPGLDDALGYVPFVIAPAVGFYAGKFTLAASTPNLRSN
ncbi:hypothetical protein AB4876_16785 [Zhongshania guokunii]|uniref:Uncharacterized protein n=1 Tax=Zhongshania guokunii TaxID=641783 RepID=A0ABV3U9F8_9GAMM